MNPSGSRAPDGSIHLALPDEEHVMERNNDTYAEIADENCCIYRYSKYVSLAELQNLSKTRIACCCCHIKVCAAMVLLFSLVGFALKYIAILRDFESDYTLQLLRMGDWYDIPIVHIGIAVAQFVSIIGLSLSVGTDCRFFVIPFIILQTILSLAQTLVVGIFVFLSAMGSLGSFERPAQHFIRFIIGYFDQDIGERIVFQGDLVVGVVVIIIVLPCLLINCYFLETAEQLFRYLRLKAMYLRLRD